MSATMMERRCPRVVLYADDDADDARLFESAVGDVCPTCKVWRTGDGQAALDTLRAAVDKGKQVDLVVLDVKMPGKDGIEVLMELKSDPRLKKLPVIIWSGLAETSNMSRAYTHGAKTFVK